MESLSCSELLPNEQQGINSFKNEEHTHPQLDEAASADQTAAKPDVVRPIVGSSHRLTNVDCMYMQTTSTDRKQSKATTTLTTHMKHI